MNKTTLFQIIFFVVTIILATTASHTQEKGHEDYHKGFYDTLKIPGTDMSCCNEKDCRPVRHRVLMMGPTKRSSTDPLLGTKFVYQVYLAVGWHTPDQSRVQFKTTPDGGAHWCGTESYTINEYGSGQQGNEPITYCLIIPQGLF